MKSSKNLFTFHESEWHWDNCDVKRYFKWGWKLRQLHDVFQADKKNFLILFDFKVIFLQMTCKIHFLFVVLIWSQLFQLKLSQQCFAHFCLFMKLIESFRKSVWLIALPITTSALSREVWLWKNPQLWEKKFQTCLLRLKKFIPPFSTAT